MNMLSNVFKKTKGVSAVVNNEPAGQIERYECCQSRLLEGFLTLRGEADIDNLRMYDGRTGQNITVSTVSESLYFADDAMKKKVVDFAYVQAALEQAAAHISFICAHLDDGVDDPSVFEYDAF